MKGIDIVDISNIDLNLLISMEALLEEKNVSRAARRLSLGQPAMSHNLARHRRLLGAERFAEHFDLSVRQLPEEIGLAPAKLMLMWHAASDKAPAHRFLRDLVAEGLRCLRGRKL